MDRTRTTLSISLICARDGVVTPKTAAEQNIDRRTLRRRRDAGQLVEILPGVFHPAGAKQDLNLRIAAAAAWLPEGAFSGRTALWFLGLTEAPDALEMVCTTGRQSPVPWLRIRRADDLPGLDIIEIDGYRVTAAYRTLIDVCGCVTKSELESLLNESWRRGMVSPKRLAEKCAPDGRPKRGCSYLLRLALDRTDRAPTDSKLEDRTIRHIRRWHLKEPVQQVVVYDVDGKRIKRMDFVYPEEKVIVECDSRKFHALETFDSDREIWSRAQTAGYLIQWATWKNTSGDGGEFIRELRKKLKLRSSKRPLNGRLVDL